ncbi:PAS domain S-box-containing protein [Gellertiella hungarica]|uniref:histidine kinase n=1 Tax=Gellertiella hungarica TaxID=1572859 RepID=A0A7W6J9E1_9HYPH|nr:PAS domain S-box-containing protein [Gellertiella hungarica]
MTSSVDGRAAAALAGFLAGDGETARLTAEFDWSGTSVGPIENWPRHMRSTVGLMMRSPVPMVTLWGEDGVMIYNDGYAAICGGRHPEVLGAKVREAWPEVADFNEHVMKTCLAGGTLAYRDQEMILFRNKGMPEQVWLDLDYSPIPDEDGKPVGVIAIVVETTPKVRAERLLRGQKDRLRQMFEQAPGFVATLFGPDHVFDMANNAYRSLIDNRDVIGKPLREALPEVVDQGFIELLDRVRTSRQPYLGRGVRVLLNRRDGGPPDERFLDFIYQPVVDDDGVTSGIFVQGHDVTEQRLAEEALRDSETRFRLVAQDAPVMLWMTDPAGRPTFLNAAIRKFWGLGPDDPPDFDWESHMHPDDLARVRARVREVPDLEPTLSEWRIRDSQGRYRILQSRAQPRYDSNGEFLGLIGVNVDVTEVRAQEIRRAALIELTDRFRLLEDPAEIAFAAAEMLARVMNVSRAGYGTIDSEKETITIDKDWNAPGIKSLAGTLQFRDYGSYIEDLKRGETVYVGDAYLDPRTAANADALKAISAQSFVNMPVTEREGLVALLYLNHEDARAWTADEIDFIRDVAERTRAASERRRAEQELKQFAQSLEQQVVERTAELDRVWRNSRDLLVVLNEDGLIRSVNPAWTAALGYSPREVLGESFRSFLSEPEESAVQFSLNDEGLKPYFIDQVIRFRHKDGSVRAIDWRITMEGHLLFAYGRDVTAEHEQAAALEQAEQQLRQAQKMEAIGQLTGGIAHDFNNLLQVISGSLQLLTREVAGNARASQHIERALAGVGRGSKLATQLLAFGRRQALEPKVINVGRFIDSIEELLHRTIGEAIEIRTIRAADLWNTLVDPSQIENAILNLAINARDAMNGVGKLTSEIANSIIDASHVSRDPDLAPGQYVVIAVTDTGSGMPPEIMARAFEPFFSTKPVGKGSGLGLSMVYGFVKQSGGHVKIYSELGEGTTVRIYLPRSSAPEERLAEQDMGPISGGNETILVAEDDDEVRATVVAMLGELGYTVLKARDAESAWTVIESGIPIDLLFTDVVMPGSLRSADLARMAKERLPNLAVLFTSGYTENSIVHDGRLDAGVELLSKPYSREALARRIRQVLATRRQEPIA